MPRFHRAISRLVLSLNPKNGLGFARINSRSSSGRTVIWSSPPMLAITALMSGSANAAWMSSARSCGLESIFRVVGNSTGFSPKSRSRRASPSS